MTDMPPPSPSAPPKTGKGLRIALAVSVALNLAVLGLVAGAMIRGGPPAHMARDLDFGPLSEALGPAERAAMRKGFFERAGDMRDMRAALRQDMAGLLAVMRADPLDRAELDRLLARQGDRLTARLAIGQALLAERIAAMDAAERTAFADRLERALSRRGGD